MKILMAATEMTPLARTGGLADVLGALPSELKTLGHDVSVVLPFYRCVRDNSGVAARSTGVRTQISIGNGDHQVEIFESIGVNGVQVFFVACNEYFDRDNLYGTGNEAFPDNAQRFICFSKAVVELARRLTPGLEVLHLHDWPTALAAALVKEQRLPFATTLTIHNVGFQGSFPATQFALTNLPPGYFTASGFEFFGSMNLLKGGILFADALTTVSDRYAQEIQTPEHGCGIDGVLRQQSAKLSGVLNGVDYEKWNPEADPWLPKRYRATALAGKKTCRNALLRDLALEKNGDGPVLAMVTRLSEEKGLDILLPILDQLLAGDVRAVIAGEGDPAYARDLLIASRRHRGKFAFVQAADEKLLHLIHAGADVALVTSHSDPSGRTAMFNLRYGTIPIAHASGGLQQIVHDFDVSTGAGNGVLYYHYSPGALWDAVRRARLLFRDPAVWQLMMRQAMTADFSWRSSAKGYEHVYEAARARSASVPL